MLIPLLCQGSSPTFRGLVVLFCNPDQAEEGYDTEQEVGPFFHAQQAEGAQDFVKTILPTTEEQEEQTHSLN